MEIIVCDDNTEAISSMERYIRQYAKKNNKSFTVLKYKSGEDLLKAYVWKPRQLIFMDMKMDTLSGHEVVRRMRDEMRDEPQVIFVTAHHSEFWQIGYQLHAFHFLTKPFKAQDIYDVLDDFFRNKLKEPVRINYFQFKRNGAKEWEVIDESQIQYFEKIQTTNKIRMVTETEEVELYETIKKVCDMVSDEFVQCHKGYVVNIRHIKRREKDRFVMRLPDKKGREVLIDIGKVYLFESIKRYVAFNSRK